MVVNYIEVEQSTTSNNFLVKNINSVSKNDF
jgi:hypothetical protein